jgi:hypothetical protein
MSVIMYDDRLYACKQGEDIVSCTLRCLLNHVHLVMRRKTRLQRYIILHSIRSPVSL